MAGGWTVESDDAVNEWHGVFYPSQRQRVQYRLWESECRIIGPPLDDSLPSPVDPKRLIYWLSTADIFIMYMVEVGTVEVIRIDPVYP